MAWWYRQRHHKGEWWLWQEWVYPGSRAMWWCDLVMRCPSSVPQPKAGKPHLVQLAPGEGQTPTCTGQGVCSSLDDTLIHCMSLYVKQAMKSVGGPLSRSVGENKGQGLVVCGNTESAVVLLGRSQFPGNIRKRRTISFVNLRSPWDYCPQWCSIVSAA